MQESKYQSKIFKAIKQNGGVAINGMYSAIGEADLQCGIPVDGRLIHVAIEVKTEKDYYRVMRCVDTDYNVTNEKGLKKHEPLQMAKIRRNRRLGGKALVAFNYNQVIDYVIRP